MDRRRLTGGSAIIALVAIIAALVWYEARLAREDATTAFAPAQSTDESVEPPAEAAPGVGGTMAANPPPADAPAADAPAAAAPETEVAMAPPADQPAPPQGADRSIQPGSAAVPSFDVVRVEPSGDAVVAGQAEPSAKVELLDGQTTIATAIANERGEWAVALDKPLLPGAHDLAIRTTSKDNRTVTLSDQRVAVSVPQAGSKDVLVVLNSPQGASKVLQVPGAGGQVAAAAPDAGAAPPAEAPAAAAPEVAVVEPPAAAAPAAAPPAEVAAAEPPATEPAPVPEGTGTEVASAPPAAAAAPAGSEAQPPVVDGVAAAEEPPVAAEPEIVAEAPVTGEPAIEGEPPIAAEPEIAANPAEKQSPVLPEAPKPQVVVAAVENDTAGNLFIAGTVTTGDSVRVYINDALVGDVAPSPSGTWLVETKRDLAPGTYNVRVDQIDKSGNVIARSEVPFEREVEVAILKPTGMVAAAEAGGGAVLSGAMPEMETVIIKRRDNLWRIARRAWGKGIRWSTIYEANTDQIRDPHWIYPGQVFLMPKGSTTWTD